MEGKKDSREGGQEEAFIPSAVTGDWLAMQSSLFSGDIKVWKGLKMWLRGIQSRCQGRSVTSTPTKTPAIERTSWHTTSCEPSNGKCFGSASRYQGSFFRSMRAISFLFLFLPFPKKFNANQSRMLNQFKMVCQLELSICLPIYCICLSAILCIFVKISY